MPRIKQIDRPVEKSISIPSSIHTRVELQLFSELEGRVPHGAWSRLTSQLMEEWLAKLPKEKQA